MDSLWNLSTLLSNGKIDRVLKLLDACIVAKHADRWVVKERTCTERMGKSIL